MLAISDACRQRLHPDRNSCRATVLDSDRSLAEITRPAELRCHIRRTTCPVGRRRCRLFPSLCRRRIAVGNLKRLQRRVKCIEHGSIPRLGAADLADRRDTDCEGGAKIFG